MSPSEERNVTDILGEQEEFPAEAPLEQAPNPNYEQRHSTRKRKRKMYELPEQSDEEEAKLLIEKLTSLGEVK